MNPIVIGALAGLATLVIGIWLFARSLATVSKFTVLHEYAGALPIDLAASVHGWTMERLQAAVGARMNPPNLKEIEVFIEILASLRYIIALRNEPSFAIQDKGRYRTGLTVAAMKLTRLNLPKIMDQFEAQNKALAPFKLPESVSRGDYDDALLEQHLLGMSEKLFASGWRPA